MKQTSKVAIISSLAMLVLFGVTILSGVVLSSSLVSADDSVVDQINITVPISCTMSGTGMNTHNAEIQNGTTNSAIGETTLKVFCNDNEGFAIYAIGYTDSTDGKNVLMNSTLGSTYDITTGTATSGDASKWAMRLSTISDSESTYPISIQNGFNSFHVVPDNYLLVAKRESSTDIGALAEGSTIKTTYQAYISSTQPAGTYTGQVKYILLHPNTEEPSGGRITYYPNGDNVIGTMSKQSARDGQSISLSIPNYSREGYGFAGWNTEPDYSGTFYGSSEIITVPEGTLANGFSLYAVWVASQGYLQDTTTTTTVCNSLTAASVDGPNTLASVSALTDQRDNQTYAIAKLADDKCWMIENLRLEAENSRGSANQDLAQGYATSDTYGNFIGLADSEILSDIDMSSVTANSIYYSGTQSGTASIDIGTLNNPGFRMPRYQSNTSGVFGNGNRYTWNAATANTSNSTTYNTSICPKGWHIPNASGSGTGAEYNRLRSSLASSSRSFFFAARIFPLNFYGGYWWSKTGLANGTHAYYWDPAGWGVDWGDGEFFHDYYVRCLKDS